MLNDPEVLQPAVDGWYPIVAVDDDGRFVRIDVECPEIGKCMVPGQFVQVMPWIPPHTETKCPTPGWHYPLLNRPFSIHRWLPGRSGISILLDRIGPGTYTIGSARPGDQLRLIGPLGQGMESSSLGKKHFVLVAGGIGVAPFDAFAELANHVGIRCTMAYGVGKMEDLVFRLGNRTRLADEMERFRCKTYLASISGESGHHGTVIDLLNNQYKLCHGCFERFDGDNHDDYLLIGCGPWAMLKALAKWAEAYKFDCTVLLEEMMGCGFGVCRSCVVPGWTTTDTKTREHCNITSCRHGAVIDAKRIDWDGSIE